MFQRKTLNLSEHLYHLEDLFTLSLCFCGIRKNTISPTNLLIIGKLVFTSVVAIVVTGFRVKFSLK